jgi:peptidoglycan hydrolase-like protein with peptidoglycan-binding domain
MSSNVGSSRGTSARAGGSSSEIADVQQHLQQLGYYKGRIDGIWGKQSRQAMAQFQRSQGMQATGQINDQSMQALNSGSTSATGSSGMNSSSSTGSSNLNSSSSSMGSSSTNSLSNPAPVRDSSQTSSQDKGANTTNPASSTAPAR